MGLAEVISARRRLDALETERLRRLATGAPQDDLLSEARALESEARSMGVPEFVAAALMRQADILMACHRPMEAVVALVDARRILGDLRQHDLLVSILGKLAEAHASLQHWETVSSICHTGIELVETYRYKVNSQYLQSAYLRFRIILYALGARAAYEMKNQGLMLERAELSKCRWVLTRQPQARDIDQDHERLVRSFRQVCRQIDSARERGEPSEELLARRRTLWDLLSIQSMQATSGAALPQFNQQAIQLLLDEDEVILYYYWIDRESLLIATIDSDHVVSELRHITQHARTQIEEFSNEVMRLKKSTSSLFYQLRDFSPLLLPESARPILDGKHRLLISPHRILHSIPFHALTWDGDALIQRFAVTYVPNLTSLLIRYDRYERQNVLALGICDYYLQSYELPALPKAEEEVEVVGRFYEGRGVPVTVLKGPQATEERMRRLEDDGRLEYFSCLHFAVHGENIDSDTPMESHLFLRDSMLDGLEIAAWKLGAETVVLSACCSGQRAVSGRGMKELPGDELFGLQAAFFAAGARRILSALWPVDSNAAVPVMTAFHAGMADGSPPEVALQQAVKTYLKSARLSLRGVYFWAPFFLSAMGRPSGKDKRG